MATPFTFVRNFLQKGQQKPVANAEAVRDHIEVREPASFGVAEAQQRFYAAIFDLPQDYKPAQQPAVPVPQRLIIDVVRNALSERDARAKAVPRLPNVIPKLLRSLRDPDTSARDYVAIINKDPTMSAAVLRLANSVYFNPAANRINSIEVAVVKLGIDGLRAVLSAAVMQPLVQRESAYFSQFGQRLWEHTLCCAVACEVIARKRGLEPYKAYLLGLTHETGKITLFTELCKQFRTERYGNGANNARPSADVFIPLMREKAASLSAAIAMDWDLPKEICAALQQQVELENGRLLSPYGHLLFQANLACEAYAIRQYRGDDDIDLERLRGDLGLPANFFANLDHLAVQV